MKHYYYKLIAIHGCKEKEYVDSHDRVRQERQWTEMNY